MAEDEPAHEVYDRMAAGYADREGNRRNRELHGEWPAVRALLPPVEGARVLDAACGSGYYAAWLADRGADVVGVDASPEMVARAVERYGDAATFLRADLRGPLAFADGSFDLVVSQLTLEHVEDWRHVFAEFARVLGDGGWLVVSTDHPFSTYFVIDHEPDDIGSADASEADYYEVERYTRTWGEESMPCYRRSLQNALEPLFGAGFVLEAVRESTPTETNEHTAYFEERMPRFLAFRARVAAGRPE